MNDLTSQAVLNRRRNIRIVLFIIIVGTLPFYCAGFLLWGTARPRGAANVTAPIGATNTPLVGEPTQIIPPSSTPFGLTPTLLSPLQPTPLQFVPIQRPPTLTPAFIPVIPTSTLAPSLTPFPTITPFPTATPLPTNTDVPPPTNTDIPPVPTNTDVPPLPTNTPLPFDPPTNTPDPSLGGGS